MRRLLILLAAIGIFGSASAGTTINGSRNILGNWDASGANTTKACKVGTAAALPATCGVGECYFETDATAGHNVFLCTATNTWTEIVGSASSPNLPTSDEKAALAGTSGSPSVTNKYVTDADARNTNARTPTGHATSHKSGGSDSIKLDELAAPTDVTTLNASTSAHGLAPKRSGVATEFLAGDGTYKELPAITSTFTSQTTVDIDISTLVGVNHVVQCFDSATLGNMVEPDTIAYTSSPANNVRVTFFAAQTGRCIVR